MKEIYQSRVAMKWITVYFLDVNIVSVNLLGEASRTNANVLITWGDRVFACNYRKLPLELENALSYEEKELILNRIREATGSNR